MKQHTDEGRARAKFPFSGYFGLALIIAAEALLFAGNEMVGHWFTPIVWTGFIFLTDALVYQFRGRSLLKTDRQELLIIVVVSIGAWWLFEFYNAPRFWRSDLELWWHYHNLVQNPHLRRVGYDWAFATIFPAMFLTAELLAETILSGMRDRRPLNLSRTSLYVVIAIGLIAALLPLLVISQWLVPLVWLSFIFLFDPLNALRGWPSITGDLMKGNYRRLASLLLSGGVCGLLWEFWNYWAVTKWTYTVPYLGHIKLFEMPVLGFLGFPPFAVECWVIYIFFRSLLGQRPGDKQLEQSRIWLASRFLE
ncbi:MAG TPA: hypothetical protein VGO91_07935 [Pyrinomonadaceae bacterium]|jgi:hypothetical protein|nr:hypothetical protein [Pyrinomonadaceae bacterium]